MPGNYWAQAEYDPFSSGASPENFETMDQQEQFFDCPFCGKTISILLDLSVPSQSYIEDCEVCCRPIEIRYTVIEDEVADFRVQCT